MLNTVKKIIDSRQITEGEVPLISFIVPVFNTRHFVLETLDSIAALGVSNIELIIVDDGSTDDSSSVISGWLNSKEVPALLLKQENQGPSEARKTGVANARGDFIGFCDSDDWINVSVYLQLAILAKSRDCDLALCRSNVFDSLTQYSHDFYDSDFWDQILEGQSAVVTNSKRDARLFRLEPNLNPRLIKRSFLIDSKITFPSGLHLSEDLPVHIEEFALANNVLLLDVTGYFYRVNRFGKLTYQKNERRFDILKSVPLALETARNHRIDVAGLGYILALASRMIFWCGQNTLNKDRSLFFTEACNLISKQFDTAAIKYCIDNCTIERDSILVAALAIKSVKFLEASASKSKIPSYAYLGLIMSKSYGRWPRKVAIRIILQKIKSVLKNG